MDTIWLKIIKNYPIKQQSSAATWKEETKLDDKINHTIGKYKLCAALSENDLKKLTKLTASYKAKYTTLRERIPNLVSMMYIISEKMDQVDILLFQSLNFINFF